jgi:predicted PurR-regulated permease PerM
MAISARNQALFWTLALAAFLLFVYVFKAVLLPFVLGAGVAYLLNPLVDYLSRFKIRRGPAALLILSSFLLIIVALIALIAPSLYRQALEFADDFPDYMDRGIRLLEPFSQKLSSLTGSDAKEGIANLARDNAAAAGAIAGAMVEQVAAGGRTLATILSVLVFMPVVAYFMMKEWTKICRWVEDILPREHKETIMHLLQQIDQKISGFVRGQLSVALILATSYAIALTIAGLKYGFLIGLVAGLLSIIPMVGSFIGLLISIGVAWFQAGDWVYVAIIASIFLVGQIIEGNFLTPKLVGDSVGLHPLWVFFALMAGGALFGILGMLLAVPVAAVAGVLLAFAIARYKAGPYYKRPERKKMTKQ